jgi:hypothetical protein
VALKDLVLNPNRLRLLLLPKPTFDIRSSRLSDTVRPVAERSDPAEVLRLALDGLKSVLKTDVALRVVAQMERMSLLLASRVCLARLRSPPRRRTRGGATERAGSVGRIGVGSTERERSGASSRRGGGRRGRLGGSVVGHDGAGGRVRESVERKATSGTDAKARLLGGEAWSRSSSAYSEPSAAGGRDRRRSRGGRGRDVAHLRGSASRNRVWLDSRALSGGRLERISVGVRRKTRSGGGGSRAG